MTDRKQFDEDTPTLGRLLCWTGLILVATLVVGQILYLVGAHALRVPVLVSAAISVSLALIVAAAFLLRYRGLPAVQEKRELLCAAKTVESERVSAVNQIEHARRHRKTIDAEAQTDSQKRCREHQDHLADIGRRRRAVDQQEQKEVSAELRRLQDEHIRSGLRSARIASATIRGVGRRLKGRLVSHGIRTAADVNATRVFQISGFGEAKTHSVALWRDRVEARLQSTQPTSVPPTTRSHIRQKHDQQRRNLDTEEKAAKPALDLDLQAIRMRAADRHAANDTSEARAERSLADIQPRIKQLNNELDRYRDINLLTFFQHCTTSVTPSRPALRRPLLMLLPLVFAASFFCQGSAALRTLAAMAQEGSPAPSILADEDDGLPGPSSANATEDDLPELPSTPVTTPVADSIATTVTSAAPSPTPRPLDTSTSTPTSTSTRTPAPTPSPTNDPGSPGSDQVVAFNQGTGAKKEYSDPSSLLGDPDLVEDPCCLGMVQLGKGGSVLLAFVDNTIVDGSGPDFAVYGESVGDDHLLVEVGDGREWRAYPKQGESPGALDLADVGLSRALFVRLTDLQPGTSTGAELDAVVALNSEPASGGELPSLPNAVARKDLTLYEGPSTLMKKVGTVQASTLLTILGTSDVPGWVKVQTARSLRGWCHIVDLGLNVVLAEFDDQQAPPTPTSSPTPAPTRPPTLTPLPSPTATLIPWPTPTPAPARSCCKICTTGKACGDTCISRSYTCHVGQGCACDG